MSLAMFIVAAMGAFLVLQSSIWLIVKIWLLAILLIVASVAVILLYGTTYMNFKSPRATAATEELERYFAEKDLRHEEHERQNRKIGAICLVIKRSDYTAQIWFTDDLTGWAIKEKFGYWFYKRRANPHPSASHMVILLDVEVPFEPSIHKLHEGACEKEEMRLRQERFNRKESRATGKGPALYLVVDRVGQEFTLVPVLDGRSSDFLIQYKASEWMSIHKVSTTPNIEAVMARMAGIRFDLGFSDRQVPANQTKIEPC